MSKMQKSAGQELLALATLTGVSFTLAGCRDDVPAQAKENRPPQSPVHVQVAQPSLSASETVTLSRAFAKLAEQSRTDQGARDVFVALQNPKVRDYIISLRDGTGSLVKNQFDATDPALGKQIVQVLQYAFNDVNQSLPPRIRALQKSAVEKNAGLPAEKAAADKALAAARAEKEQFYSTNKTEWNLELDKKVASAEMRAEQARYNLQWGPKSEIANYKEDKLKALKLDGDYGRGTDVAAATAFDRIRFLDPSSPPLRTSKGANDTGLEGRHIKALAKYSPAIGAWLKADGKNIHEAAQSAISGKR